MDARTATSRTSPGSLRSATHAQRLASAGTLVRVLEPPVKDGVNPVRRRYGFMPWSTGHGLVTMLELHALSVRQGACVEHRGLCIGEGVLGEELLMWKRNRSMFVYGVSTPASYGG